MKPYDSLRRVNVMGTLEVLRLSATANTLLSRRDPRVRSVFYVSSNGVFPMAQHGGPTVCLESDSLDGYAALLQDG